MHRGYFALWRKFQDHVFWKEKRVFSKAEAWIDILWEAQHEKEPQDVIIKMQILKCFYGQSLKSIRTWATRWGWGEAKTHRFLKLLKNMDQIDTQSETVTTRLTVLNYSQYDIRSQKNETQTKRQRNTSETRAKTDKNDKNVKNKTPEPLLRNKGSSDEPPLDEIMKEGSIPKIKEELTKLSDELYESKIFRDAPKFKNTMLKKKKNPRAILHALIRCKLTEPKEPWAYCEKIMQVEDGNYHERDYGKTEI